MSGARAWLQPLADQVSQAAAAASGSSPGTSAALQGSPSGGSSHSSRPQPPGEHASGGGSRAINLPGVRIGQQPALASTAGAGAFAADEVSDEDALAGRFDHLDGLGLRSAAMAPVASPPELSLLQAAARSSTE